MKIKAEKDQLQGNDPSTFLLVFLSFADDISLFALQSLFLALRAR